MTDDRIEKLIWHELKTRDVCFYDMIGLPNYGVDPEPENKAVSTTRRTRQNRFKGLLGCERMKELLCLGDYNPYDNYPLLKVSIQDFFRFWWNRCVEKELVVDEILEDIYDYFTEKMRPPQKEKESMDVTVDFKKLSISMTDLDQAA